MRHTKAIYLLEGFQPDELSPRQKASLDAHLASCSDCARRAAGTPSLRSFFGAPGSQAIPGFDQALESVRQSTLRAVRLEGARREGWLPVWARWGAWQSMAVPAAALAAVVVVGVAVQLSGRLEEPAREGTQATLRGDATPTPEETAPPSAEPSASADISVPAASALESRRPRARGSRRGEAELASFEMVRSGSEVRIEWDRMRKVHRVRKSQDPQTVLLASRHVVHGSSWTDPGNGQAPGSVTYYLVD